MRIDLDELERLAKAATPQNIDAAEIIEGDEGKTIECPACSGEGYVSLEGDYCNFDGCAIGVQFYGIGNEHGAAERYYRAANPAVVIELARRLREAEEIEGVLIDALEQCRGRFAYYVQHHLDKGDLDKAAGNEFWVKVADDAIAKACRATHPVLSSELSVEYLPQAVDRAWARFCGAFGDGPDAPYPGMIAAFETHYGQSFRDKEWRSEAACWAAAWHKATEQAAKNQEAKSGD